VRREVDVLPPAHPWLAVVRADGAGVLVADLSLFEGGREMNGIWVRSQSRRALVLAASAFVVPQSDGVWQININSTRFHGALVVETVAKYPTEQRALEVLDEIQEQVEQAARYGNPAGAGVYQMPAE
jgi:hypothetical protein